MGQVLEWERAGRDWPNREVSRFVTAAGLRWHVQQMGRGPVALLVHGTGAANHSWRTLAPLLAERFTVVAPDLPGHGFSAALPPERMTLPGMAGALGELLRALGLSPDLAIGHSAGAAILVRMSLDGGIRPRGIVSLNGALLPLRGWAGLFFSPVAKLCALSPRVAGFIARRATDPSAVERLIQGTGSTLDPAGVELYRRLISSPGHVAGAINMMANWELQSLERDLPRLTCPLALVVADRDRTVPPDEADLVLARLPTARRIALSGLGHLAHEEDAARVEAVVLQFARSVGVLLEP